MRNQTAFEDLIRKFEPDLTDEECDFILWEKTAFPFCDMETVEGQLKDFFDKEKCKDCKGCRK
ncbi:MAG: hypothetical protein GY804_00095 [Alphaproteobacteria bacterium]|nr:hypothetical protein [Alphaproteobacteria bacterium]